MLTIYTGRNPARYVNADQFPGDIHPIDQHKATIELIQRVTSLQEDVRIITHSPYVLTTINNSLQAGLISPPGLLEIIAIDRILPRSVVKAFEVTESGEFRSIIDPETGLIDCSSIDRVSDQIAEEFDRLVTYFHANPTV